MADAKKTPGWRLRRWRVLNELTQAQAAKLFAISQPVLSQYELGQRSPADSGTKERIRAHTGVVFP